MIVISDFDNYLNPDTDKDKINQIISKLNNLPSVGTYDNFQKLMSNFRNSQINYLVSPMLSIAGMTNLLSSGAVMDNSAQPMTPASNGVQKSGSSSESPGSYSTTNLQVEGVDESDIVKNDGEFIYQVNKDRIVILKAYPAQDMNIQSVIDYNNTDKDFTPNEIFVDSNYLIVIGNYLNMVDDTTYYSSSMNGTNVIPPLIMPRDTVKVIVYDIADKTKPQNIREIELDGSYISSRKIGSSVYLVSNKNILYYSNESDPNLFKPCYRDTCIKDDYINIEYNQIRYFPHISQSNYMIVAAFDLLKPREAVNIYTYLGSGDNIYASEQNLYVAVTLFDNQIGIAQPMITPKVGLAVSTNNTQVIRMPIFRPIDNSKTVFYKFSVNAGSITYLNKGEVPGTILNQFSMDENNNYFRIATTKGYTFASNEENISKNNLYVLNDTMNIVGKIEDIAPGEKIYSVRFMGDKAFMVTFKTVDPLFALDLKNPVNPKIIGSLKIPGYSDYIQPYDENHIIGFGKEAIANKGMAYYLGMKVAIFDVTDMANPKQMFPAVIIGDRGTDSELLSNHKVLLFAKSKNLLAFPVTVAEINNKDALMNKDFGIPQYGQFTYQGAYVYSIDLTNGLKLKGRITHISDEEYKKAGDSWYNSDSNVDRIIYINNVLYTLSNGKIKANSLNDLSAIKTLVIP